MGDGSTPTDLSGSDWLSDARFNECFCCRRADCLRGKMCSVADKPSLELDYSMYKHYSCSILTLL